MVEGKLLYHRYLNINQDRAKNIVSGYFGNRPNLKISFCSYSVRLFN